MRTCDIRVSSRDLMKSGNACSSMLAGSSFAIASMNVSLVAMTTSRKLMQSAISVRNGTTLRNIPMVLWNSSSVRPELEFHNRSEEHTSELQSHLNLVCRLLLEKKKT